MASLLATLFIAGCFLCYSSKQEYRVKLERVKIYGNYFSQKTKLTFENFAQSLHILSRVITWQNGKTDLYEEIAEHLIQIIPETLNINLAKNGIVSHVYPYERNKNTIYCFQKPAKRKPGLPLQQGKSPFPDRSNSCRAERDSRSGRRYFCPKQMPKPYPIPNTLQTMNIFGASSL